MRDTGPVGVSLDLSPNEKGEEPSEAAKASHIHRNWFDECKSDSLFLEPDL